MQRFADPVTSLCAYCDGNVERLGLVRERAYQTQSSRIRFEIRLLTKDEGSKWCREGREYVRSVASVSRQAQNRWLWAKRWRVTCAWTRDLPPKHTQACEVQKESRFEVTSGDNGTSAASGGTTRLVVSFSRVVLSWRVSLVKITRRGVGVVWKRQENAFGGEKACAFGCESCCSNACIGEKGNE
jgi:hypothetical protein